MKKTISIFLSLILVINLVGCDNSNVEYIEKVKKTEETLHDTGLEALAISSLLIDVWRDTIYKETNKNTIKFTTDSDGHFNEDFNTSIQKFYSDDIIKEKITTLKNNQDKNTKAVMELRDFPEECENIFNTLKEFSAVVDEAINSAVTPKGTLKDYSSKSVEMSSKFSELARQLKLEIELVEDKSNK